MNSTARQLIEKRMHDSRSSGDYNFSNFGNDSANTNNNDNRRDYARGYADGRRDYEDEMDNRRGMRNSGRRRDRNSLKLSREDISNWKRKLRNKDGTTGPHFDMQEVLNAANKIGVDFTDYDEAEFCMTMNMKYSHDCEALRNLISPEKEAVKYAEMAKTWLEDDDASSTGSEKLAVYYYCIVAND